MISYIKFIFYLLLVLLVLKIVLTYYTYPKKYKFENIPYIEKKEHVLQQFKNIQNIQNQNNGKKIKLAKDDTHLYRPRDNGKRILLNLNFLNKVINLDIENQTVHVEGFMRYDDLINYTLKYGLLPKIVPELRSITVGGVISGIGIESSSFKFGLTHNIMKEMEILTGNGDILIANEHTNSDLFYSFPNTYGTIGYILSAHLELIPVKKYVNLRNIVFDNPREFINEIAKYDNGNNPDNTDFMDGLIISEDKFILIKGTMSDVANSEISNYKYKSYYKNVENISEDCLTIKDYLWRYDVGYFFTANTLFSNKFFRHYMGDILQSDRISKIGKLLKLPNKDEAIINDLILTPNNFVEFFNWYNKNINVYPVWICPTKCVDTFSFVRCDNSLEIDFGVGFGVRKPFDKNIENDVNYYKKLIDKKMYSMGMKKGLYSNVLLTKSEFYNLYDSNNLYPSLKKKYDKNNRFYDLYEKVVNNK